MKRGIKFAFVILACAGIGWAAYRAASSPARQLSKYVPTGSLLYLEARDLSSLLTDWNSSQQKKLWIASANYDVFSRSRLFLRLKAASDQFAVAAGLHPDMNFLSQVSGERSVLALYDIGELQFLYITYLPSAKSLQTTLWQTRAKFETRSVDGASFYIRRDLESHREVAFAVSGDYLLLATREDLMAGALRLMSDKPGRNVEGEQWWAQSTAAAERAGDLRMVLNLEKLVPNGYFRTYWAQQNITDLGQYSAGVSDLFKDAKQYREERVLIRKKEQKLGAAEGLAAAADLTRLVPDNTGVYLAVANPGANSCFALLESKLMAPHGGQSPASQMAPQVQLTSGEQGEGSDLETRIDAAPDERLATPQLTSTLKGLLDKAPIVASLQVQSTERDQAGVFVRTHTVIVLAASSDWNPTEFQSALAEFVGAGVTASGLGVGWRQQSAHQELDGLLPLVASVRGKYLFVGDDALLMEAMLTNLNRAPNRKPAEILAVFNHQRERANFARLASVVDGPSAVGVNGSKGERHPQFFSGNIAGLSAALADLSAEKIEVRGDESKVRQTITYEWSE